MIYINHIIIFCYLVSFLVSDMCRWVITRYFHGIASTPQRGNYASNPVLNGRVTRCNICDSTCHYARKSPHGGSRAGGGIDHSRQVLECTGGSGFTECSLVEQLETVNITLVTGSETDQSYDVFVAETSQCAVLDTACTRTVCGKLWLNAFLQTMETSCRENVTYLPSSKPFRFGDTPVVYSLGRVMLPVKIQDTHCEIDCEVVERNVPMLLSKSSLKASCTIIDFQRDKVQMFGKQWMWTCSKRPAGIMQFVCNLQTRNVTRLCC